LHRSGTASAGNIGTSIDSHEVTTMFQPSQREPAFLRRKDVQIRTGLARSTIYLYIQQGAFPKPVSLGPRAVAWLESEVSAWITERVRVARDHQRGAR
jgi:prophage regulatory protein